MHTNKKFVLTLLSILLFLHSSVFARNLSPVDFGLIEAKSGIERYNVLMAVHQEAVRTGQGVSYAGIGKISIEVPSSPKSIPLSSFTDFAGVELEVLNQQKNFHLFTMFGERKSINVDKRLLENNNFRAVDELSKGRKVLIIEDLTPWVKERKGYDVGANRGDILYIQQGKVKNKLIESYSSDSSNPSFSFFEGSKRPSVIKNLVFKRHNQSTSITYLLFIDCKDNVHITNLSIHTPSSEMYADQIITIKRSTNVIFKDISIDGTYSSSNRYGYGISMNNVWNTCFINLIARCNWGVFGNYNVNKALLNNCDINRFDIHCYGKDVTCYKTTFRDLYNQFSSLYGTLMYKKCRFVNSVPVLIEDTFGAYTPFNIVFKDCDIVVDDKSPFLIAAGNVNPDKKNLREELLSVHLPSVSLLNVHMSISQNVIDYFIYSVAKSDHSIIVGDNNVLVDKFTVDGASKGCRIAYSNQSLNHINPPHININKELKNNWIYSY